MGHFDHAAGQALEHAVALRLGRLVGFHLLDGARSVLPQVAERGRDGRLC